MKKFVAIICMFVMAFLLVGCNSSEVANAEDYEIDKEVEVTEELSFEEAKAKVEELEETEGKYLTYQMMMKAEEIETTANVILVEENGVYNGSMIANVKVGSTESKTEMYIKDSYMLLEIPFLGKLKTKIPTAEDVKESINDTDSEELLNQFFELAAAHSDKVKAGFDKAGCLILDYAEGDVKFRFVYDKAFPVYFYAQLNTETITEFKFSYDKAEVEFPEGLDMDSYKEISWDEFNGMGSIE